MKKKHETSESYLEEVTLNLQRDVFEVEGRQVSYLGKPLCQLTENGGITFKPDDVKGKLRESVKNRAMEIIRNTYEYMRQMELAPFLKADGLEEKFKLLAEFNGVVFAGQHSKYGVQFVTWDRTYDQKGVTQGHYFSDNYAEAKRDFVIRSGLVERERLFTDQQLKTIGCGCTTILNDSYSLSQEQEACLQEVQKQIHEVFPEASAERYQQDLEYPVQTM